MEVFSASGGGEEVMVVVGSGEEGMGFFLALAGGFKGVSWMSE